ncbi:hypothetical protein IMSHALPRED_002082 [Imshaugia aleurites]|uniref:Uncharacterized protein n=1 Tax=Imshaugia aleurites TaxID=172621 RepID=A0A8H3PGW6_9LECA|nr:hypothetical protein IMSHALPRED_002082 [Imshaugia aleurites]
MSSSRHILLLAILTSLLPSLVAIDIPIIPNDSLPVNFSNTLSPLWPPLRSAKLTFTPWPAAPYDITIPSTPANLRFGKIGKFNSKQTVVFDLDHARDFFKAFGENLERQGDLVPRYARDTTIDMRSYTQWQIDFDELPLGYRLPTTWAVGALDVLDAEISAHGVPSYVLAAVNEGGHQYSILVLQVKAIAATAGNVSSLGAVGGDLLSD